MLGLSGNLSKVVGLGAAVFLLVVPAASAEDITEAQILKALTPPKTRSLSLGAPAKAIPSADDTFINSMRNKSTNALTADERNKIGDVAANKPAIDLTMEFARNSDVLRGDALVTAHKLGKALTSAELKGQTFVIAGHTDAKGGDTINQSLSERRADSVKRFLVKNYGIPAENLIGVGYGKTHLKDAADPLGKENRRVQTVNMLQVQTAAR